MLLLAMFACEGPGVPIRGGDPLPKDTAAGEDSASPEESDSPVDSDPPADTADTGEPAPMALWTILVFANGDNDLEEWALADANEMEQVGSSADINIIVQIDRSSKGTKLDGNWSGARRYRIEQDTDDSRIASPVLMDLGDVDSGRPQAIIDFVEWGVQYYPAERVALVLWDHGDNWYFAPEPSVAGTKGISYDYSSGHNLSVAEGDLDEALAGATAALGRPFDLLGSDACTMQSWEVATTIAPYADIYVGSQDYEALEGWAYDDWLADLAADPTMDAATVGAFIAQRFYEIPDSTMSVIDTTKIDALSRALDDLAAQIIASGDAATVFPPAAQASQGFDGAASYDHDLLDLIDNLDANTTAFTSTTTGVRDALAELVLENYAMKRVPGAQGLSIYSPTNGRIDRTWQGGAWCEDHQWDEMLAETK